MRRATLLLLAALLPLATAVRPHVRGLAEAAAEPLDGSEPEGWYLSQTDTFPRRSTVINLPGGKTFTLVLPRMLKDSKVRHRIPTAGGLARMRRWSWRRSSAGMFTLPLAPCPTHQVFPRNYNDTCGLYSLVVDDGEPGGGRAGWPPGGSRL